MRNLQKNLLDPWKNTNKISELINNLPKLIDSIEYQVQEGLLPCIGEYSHNKYRYNINDFLANPNNKLFKIKIPTHGNSEINFEERYIVVTSSTFIILNSISPTFKNICVVNFVGELFGIEKIIRFFEEDKEYKEISCIQFKWNVSAPGYIKDTLCADTDTLIIKELSELLIKRRDNLLKNFKLFENSDSNDVPGYEKIVAIKKKLVENQKFEPIYMNIMNIYQKIIELFTVSNDNNYQKYIKELQEFTVIYDKIK